MLITWKTFPSSRTRRDPYIKIYLLKQPQWIMSLNSNMSNNSCEFLHKTFLTLIQNNIFEIHQVINRNIRSLLYKPSSTKKIYKVTTVTTVHSSLFYGLSTNEFKDVVKICVGNSYLYNFIYNFNLGYWWQPLITIWEVCHHNAVLYIQKVF